MDQIDCGFKNNAKLNVKASSPVLAESQIEIKDSVKKDVYDKSEFVSNINSMDQSSMNYSEISKGTGKSRGTAFSSINNDQMNTRPGTGIDQSN